MVHTKKTPVSFICQALDSGKFAPSLKTNTFISPGKMPIPVVASAACWDAATDAAPSAVAYCKWLLLLLLLAGCCCCGLLHLTAAAVSASAAAAAAAC